MSPWVVARIGSSRRASRASGGGRGRAVKSVAVVGASGAVGEVMVRLLAERKFPVGSIKFLASERSAGKSIEFGGESHPIEPLSRRGVRGGRHRPVEHPGVGLARVLARSPRGPARWWSTTPAPSGWTPTSRWSSPRSTRSDVARHKGIIANPNCSTIQMVVALKPLHDAFRIRRVVVSTYQSVSGAGPEGDARALVADRGPRRRHGRARPRPSSPTRSPSTASRRSTTSSPTGTPRKR